MELRNREIKKLAEMESIIHEAEVCYVGMVYGTNPYVLPFNFAYENKTLFLHSDNQGKKIEVLKTNPRVAVNFNTGNEVFYRHKQVGCSWGMKYKSVLAFGEVRFVDDYQRKYQIMQKIMNKYSGEEYDFSEPSIKNVCIMEIVIDDISGKKFGY